MEKIKWLFFDMGSTIVDEMECLEYRIKETLKQKNAPKEDLFVKCMEYNMLAKKSPYMDAVKKYGLKAVKWPTEKEKLYPGVVSVLSELKKKYKLGIIANQVQGTEERLKNWGILDYFDVIIASAEVGLEKPDQAIFNKGLSLAGCKANEACMIGDRLDNDIEPAISLGMHTIWIEQGWSVKMYSRDMLKICKPEIHIKEISELLNYL